jgi:hypothetical protein
VPEQDTIAIRADRSRGSDELVLADGQHLAAHEARVLRPKDEANGD